VLAADVVVAEAERLLGAELESALGQRLERKVVLERAVARRGHRRRQLRAQICDFDVERGQHLECEIAALVDDAEQDVLGADVVVGALARRPLREGDRVAGSGGEPGEQTDPRMLVAGRPVGAAGRAHVAGRALERRLADARDGELRLPYRLRQVVGEVDVDLGHGVMLGVYRPCVNGHEDGGVDGVHDLGGMQGFGPVEVEADEPVFHEDWEGRVFGLAGGALGAGGFNTPMFRHAIERMDPGHYLTSSYYEHWLTAVATLLVEEGMISRDVDALVDAFPLSRPPTVDADDVANGLQAAEPRFTVGDAVRVRDLQFAGHTRCPRYVRGRRGVVVRMGPAAPVPEVEAHRRERLLEHTYGVRFEAAEIWGDESANAAVHVDLYECYLEPA
jgi:nitrile hydratase subunit beta